VTIAPPAHHRPVTDRDPFEDLRPRTDEHIVADHHRCAPRRVGAMPIRELEPMEITIHDFDIRADQTSPSDPDR
jgi:hypothetical protein